MRYVLKVDLDYRLDKWGWLEIYKKCVRAILENVFKCEVERIIVDEYEPNAHGLHVWIWVKSRRKLKPWELNMMQFFCYDDPGRVMINATRILRGIPWERANKLFSKVLWRKEHKCNCEIHQKILKRMREGNKALEDMAKVMKKIRWIE